MSNKAIIISIILLSLAFFAPITSAITLTASETSRPFKAIFKENREDFREKLQEIKDTRKREIAQRVDEKLTKVNINSTDRMNLAIVKLETLLEKFTSKAATFKSLGKDTTDLDTTIIVAKDAISDAKDAVAQQAAIVYTADLSDETALKNNFGKAMSNLRKDLNATHDVVKLAKQKVMDVARTLNKTNMTPPFL